MVSWHGYILLTKPSEISVGDWSTIISYLDNSGVLNDNAMANQPSERWHVQESDGSYLIESTFDTAELTLTGMATHYSAALGGTPNVTTMEGYLDDGAGDIHWQVFEKGEYIAASREAARHHIKVYGFACRGPRTSDGDEWYVAVNGNASNDGSIGSPWTLAHVLSGAAGVQQKDVIWLRGGNYGKLPEVLISGYSDDSVNQPITFQGYYDDWIAGIYPIIYGSDYAIKSPDITFRNLVITGIETERFTEEGGSQPETYDNNAGFNIQAPNITLINGFIHNANGAGIGNWEDGPNMLCYGTLIHNNGWDSDDSRSGPLYDGYGNRTLERFGHGHGQYVQNVTGYKRNKHSIFLPCFGRTYSAHSASGIGSLNGVEFLQCLIFGFGSEVGWTGSPSIVMDALLTDSIIQAIFIGQSGSGGSATINDNYFVNDNGRAIRMRGLDVGSFDGNVTLTPDENLIFIYQLPVSQAAFVFDNNEYYTAEDSTEDVIDTGGDGTGNPKYTSSEWLATGRDPNSNFNHESEPTGHTDVIWPNEYKDANDPRVGIFIVLNWEEAGSVNVDLSLLGMVNLQDYKFYNAFNYFNDAPIEYTSDGSDTSVSIVMTGWSMAVPSGTHQGNAMNEPLDSMPSKIRVFIVEEA